MRPSKRAPAAAEEAACPVATLPLAQALEHVIPFLPVHERARAACVCRSWCNVLAPESLWLRLDLSGYLCSFPNADALLLGASARARGRLSHLDVSGPLEFTAQALLSVLTANADHLRELRVSSLDDEEGKNPTLAALLQAAPLLQVLDATCASCDVQGARALLRAGPLLRLRSLSVNLEDVGGYGSAHWPFASPESVIEFAAVLKDSTLQPALSEVTLLCALTSDIAVTDAVADAALSRGLSRLSLCGCTPPAPVPLARLIAGGALKSLSLMGVMTATLSPAGVAPFRLDEACAKIVADALRSTKSLTSISLMCASLSRDTGAAAALLGACAGHPSLEGISVSGDGADNPAALGVALASIVAADSPALRFLYIPGNQLGDAGLAPIMDALPGNRHLPHLIMHNNGMSENFARLRLLPAVRANTGLRGLCAVTRDSEAMPAAVEAEALVNERHKEATRSCTT